MDAEEKVPVRNSQGRAGSRNSPGNVDLRMEELLPGERAEVSDPGPRPSEPTVAPAGAPDNPRRPFVRCGSSSPNVSDIGRASLSGNLFRFEPHAVQDVLVQRVHSEPFRPSPRPARAKQRLISRTERDTGLIRGDLCECETAGLQHDRSVLDLCLLDHIETQNVSRFTGADSLDEPAFAVDADLYIAHVFHAAAR